MVAGASADYPEIVLGKFWGENGSGYRPYTPALLPTSTMPVL